MNNNEQDELFCILDTEYTFNGLSNDANEIKQIILTKYGIDADIQQIELWLEPTLSELIEDKIILSRTLGIWY
jgi:uncharacterized protein with PhoU and TrkA domain